MFDKGNFIEWGWKIAENCDEINSIWEKEKKRISTRYLDERESQILWQKEILEYDVDG